MNQEKLFDKYKARGSMHWREMMSRDPRFFNAYQQARYDWILRVAGDIRGKKVLDLGCGDGSLTYLLAKNGAIVTGVDNEELGLQFARENLTSMKQQRELRYELITASAYQL
ncbi:methyltransferase domain-containing protein, partial [Candidatus Microgenomates bacterium]|nr:methyltransferase domain-containing protein [Candidatus Microgenomates bacterium]